jgi:hypothetical protein
MRKAAAIADLWAKIAPWPDECAAPVEVERAEAA